MEADRQVLQCLLALLLPYFLCPVRAGSRPNGNNAKPVYGTAMPEPQHHI